MKTIVTGLLGCGNIGCGVFRLIESFSDEIAHRRGVRFLIKRILVRDVDKQREAQVPKNLLTTEPTEVLDDPYISLVVELMGGEEPASTYILRALKHGKTVVTANKMAMAMNWHRFREAEDEGGGGLYFEGSVCGAIPIIRTLSESLQANRIDTLMGIVNGTTNHILSAMSGSGEDYAQALEEAQRLGLAEPDPSSDVDGHDAVYKLSILASLAFHSRIPWKHVYREGISRITAQDLAFGRDLGFTLKLLAIARRAGNRVDARVHPTFIPDAHPQASVSGSFNAIYLRGHACGEMMLFGRGAGSGPTSSAVVGDMLQAAGRLKHPAPTFRNEADLPRELTVEDDWACEFYLRFSAADRPGVLGHVATCFAEKGISIKTLMQRNPVSAQSVPIVMVTHPARERALRSALSLIDQRMASLGSLIRVEQTSPDGGDSLWILPIPSP